MKTGMMIVMLLLLAVTTVWAQLPVPTDDDLKQMGMTREEYNAMLGNLVQSMPDMIEAGPYTSEEYGYTVDIPDGWSGMNHMGQLAMYQGAMEDLSSDNVTVIQVVVGEANEGEEEEIARARNGDMSEQELQQMVELAPEGHDAKTTVLEFGPAEIDGFDALMLVTKHEGEHSDGSPMVFLSRMYTVVKDDMIYTLGYVAPEDKWADFKGFVETHTKTFHFE